jgi:hypothetical protein
MQPSMRRVICITCSRVFLAQACCVHLFALTCADSHAIATREATTMKIHATTYACYVSLRNGLTLELTFDPAPPQQHRSGGIRVAAERPLRSSGVWMFHEEVLFEARVGLA